MNRFNWIFCALAAIVLWSSLAFLGTRLAHVPPFLLVGTALLIGSLPSLGGVREWAKDLRLLAFGVAGIFGYHFLLFMALRLAPPVEANLINYLWPVLIVLLSPILLKGYPLKPANVFGGLIAFCGAALIATGGRLHFDPSHWVGHLLALLAALTWAFYSVLTKRLPPFSTAAVGGFCFFSGLLALGCHALLEDPARLTGGDAWRLAILGLGPMGLAFYAWDAALKNGDPRKVGALSYLTPLLSTLWLIVLGGQALTPVIVWAMVLIVGGALIGSGLLEKRPQFFDRAEAFAGGDGG